MKNPKLALLAIVAVLSLILAACDDDGGEIPADHEGRVQCLVCHADGVGDAPELPRRPDHSTLADDPMVCAACHTGE